VPFEQFFNYIIGRSVIVDYDVYFLVDQRNWIVILYIVLSDTTVRGVLLNSDTTVRDVLLNSGTLSGIRARPVFYLAP